MDGAPKFRLVEGYAAEAARIDEADFACGCFPGRAAEGEDGVGVGRERDLGCGDEEAARHAEVDEEFGRGFVPPDGHHDGLADAADGFDARAGEGGGDLRLGRLEGLRLAAGPYGGDARTVDAGMDACGDGLDFGKLGHKN